MFANIMDAVVLTGASVIVHAAGTTLVSSRFQNRLPEKWSPARVGVAFAALAAQLLVLHVLEAALWAVMYYHRGLLPDGETAMYFSLASYTTVGYGDVVLPLTSRMLGPIEAVVGILLLGWSTAVIINAKERINEVFGRRHRK